MRDKKDKVKIILILFVVIGALVFSATGFVRAFKGKPSNAVQSTVDSNISQSESVQNEPESVLPPDSQETESEEAANSQALSVSQSAEPEMTDDEASDNLATLYGSNMFGAEQPKDLLENKEFMTALQEYGMSEEEIQTAINELQTAFEEGNS